MKKLLLLAAVCLLSLSLPANSDLPVTSSVNLKALDVQQSTDWEYLGNIVGIANGGATYNAKLYYRVIGQREFFQVRYIYDILTGKEKTSSVTLGSFVFRGKQYNAKFEREAIGWTTSETYYFNL